MQLGFDDESMIRSRERFRKLGKGRVIQEEARLNIYTGRKKYAKKNHRSRVHRYEREYRNRRD